MDNELLVWGDGDGLCAFSLGIETNEEELILDVRARRERHDFSNERDPVACWLQIDGRCCADKVEVCNRIVENVLDDRAIVS